MKFMRIIFFSSKPYDAEFFKAANHSHGHELTFLEAHLNEDTAPLAKNADAVCIFVNDVADHNVISSLAAIGVKFIALRCAGYNNVDLTSAHEQGLTRIGLFASFGKIFIQRE
jgi:D-lactate dehydrogenase